MSGNTPIPDDTTPPQHSADYATQQSDAAHPELSIETLEADGDLAADYLEGLLDITDLDGDLNITVANQRAYVSITGGNQDLDALATPNAVQALQDLTRLAVQAKTGRFSRLIIDVAGSRDARQSQLIGLVDAAIAQIAAGRQEVQLEPMSSYERKLVHDEVAQRGYHSQSRGEGRNRRLVITGN